MTTSELTQWLTVHEQHLLRAKSYGDQGAAEIIRAYRYFSLESTNQYRYGTLVIAVENYRARKAQIEPIECPDCHSTRTEQLRPSFKWQAALWTCWDCQTEFTLETTR